MKEADANEALLQHWNTQWTTLHPATPGDFVHYTLENEVDDSLVEYVRVTIAPTARRNRTIGPQIIKEQMGLVAVQVFTRAGTGTQRISQLCDDVRTALENRAVSVAGTDEQVNLYAGASSRGSTDAVWQMQLVTVPFTYLDR